MQPVIMKRPTIRQRKTLGLILKLSLILLACISVFTPQQAKASHAAGGELIYEHISGTQYRFFFKFYRDCSGATAPSSAPLCIYNTCTNTSFSTTMNAYNGSIPPYGLPNGSSVSAGCSSYPNKCDNSGSTLPGYQEWWYTAIVTLPNLQCNYFKFATWIGVRNPSNNIAGGNFYIETIFNTQVSWNNSSPNFSVKPVPYMCINSNYTFNNGAVDVDGDSLWSEVINPLVGATCNTPATNMALTTMTPPITFPSNPIQTNNTFTINGSTGQLNFVPGQIGPSTLTVKTSEYRGGTQIGSIMRDVQVQVINCTATPVNINPPTGQITGGTVVNGQVQGCIDQKLEFCFDAVQPSDTEAVLIVEDNHSFSIPKATITYSNQKTDSVRGCFSWTPEAKDVGLHNLIVTIKDSTCRPPGILLYHVKSFPIYIWGPTKAVGDTTICPGQPAYLGASGGGNYSWTILPGGSPNSISPTTGANPTATPLTTTSYVVTSNATSFCSNNKDTVDIEVLKGPVLFRQNDTITCPGETLQLNVGIDPNQFPGATYTYKWTPAVYLSNDTIPNPTSKPANNVTYLVEVGSDSSKCKAYDTIFVDVLDGFSIETPDTAICDGDQFKIRATGDSRYTYAWTGGPSGGVIVAPSDLDPTITVQGNSGSYTYEIRASYAGCKDSIAKLKVDLQPVPVVEVGQDASLCFGDTLTLHGVVTPTYDKYTYTWTPATSLSNANKLDPIFTASTTSTLTLTATTPAGCKSSDSLKLNVYPADFLKLPNDTAICSGGKIRLTLEAAGATDFHWSPDFNISDVKSLNPELSPVTDQFYYVYGVDTSGCYDTAQVFIAVKPAAIVDLPDTVKLYAGEKYQMNPGGNALYYNWFPPLGLSNPNIANPIASPDVNTRYIITAKTEANCTATDSVDVLVINDSYIEVPNAFTPGRGPNGTLHLIRRGDVELKSYAIFNRWGTKVFEATSADEGWDGRYNGEPQPMGVYIYQIEAVTPAGRTINKQGNITLIR